MGNFMWALKKRMGFLDTPLGNFVLGVVVFLNPVAMLPQLKIAVLAPAEQLAGVSVGTFILFVFIQVAVASSAVKAMDWKLFFSMAISAVLTLAIVFFVVVRGWLLI